MKRIYIAGPMRGYPQMNVPAFRDAAARLRALGHEVISPAEIDHGDEGRGDLAPEHYLRNDLRALIDCEAIALLPGWQFSTGARCEAAVAITLGLAFYCAGSGARIPTPASVRVEGGYERPVEVPA